MKGNATQVMVVQWLPARVRSMPYPIEWLQSTPIKLKAIRISPIRNLNIVTSRSHMKSTNHTPFRIVPGAYACCECALKYRHSKKVYWMSTKSTYVTFTLLCPPVARRSCDSTLTSVVRSFVNQPGQMERTGSDRLLAAFERRFFDKNGFNRLDVWLWAFPSKITPTANQKSRNSSHRFKQMAA